MTDKCKRIIASYISNYEGIPVAVWGMITLDFISTTLTAAFYFLSYYFVHTLHYDIKTASFFISFYGLGAIMGGLIGGKLSDEYSPSVISALSILLQGLTFLLFIKFKTAKLIIFNICLFGVAAYSFITANYLAVLEGCAKNENQNLKAINILSVVSNLGLSVAAIIIGLFSNLNFKYLFLYCGLILLIVGLGCLFFCDQYKKQKKSKDGVAEGQSRNLSNSTKINYLNIYFILFALLLVGIIVAQMSSTYSIHLKSNFPEYGLSGFSAVFLINTVLIIALQAPLGSLFSGKDKMLCVGIGGLLVAMGMALLGFANNFCVVVLACMVYTFGEMIFFSLSQLVCYENSPVDKRGLWAGVYRMVFASSRVIGPALGGTIYLHFGSPVLWFLCFGMGICCFAACIAIKMYVPVVEQFS